MIDTRFKVIFLLALIASLCSPGDTCTPGVSTADPDACNRYYLCIKSGAATINIPQECSAGKGFDPDRGYCIANYDCLICD